MPRKEWTAERKAEASRRAKERWQQAKNAAMTAAIDQAEAKFPVEERERAANYDPQRKGSPAIIPSWHQIASLRLVGRSVKMLRARCDICQRSPRKNWMLHCTHGPYTTLVPIQVQRPVYEDEIVDGKPTGARIVKSVQTVETYELRPNAVEVSTSSNVNGGIGVQRAMWFKGYLFPEDLGSVVPSEEFPNGIAPACMFKGCFEQTGLKKYRHGTFCREEEARLVTWQEESAERGALEAGWDQASETRRRVQLNEVAV